MEKLRGLQNKRTLGGVGRIWANPVGVREAKDCWLALERKTWEHPTVEYRVR